MPGDIEHCLLAFGQTGAFATRHLVASGDLCIEVKEVGKIRLPVSPSTARKLRRVARQAGYGRRERTLVDRRVRDTWEIASSRVKVDQRRWNRTLGPALERIKRDLGLPAEGRLVARLHKLLVYEAGQFFVSHQDSEKSDDMVGTLSVALPSAYKGGSVILEHHGQKITFRRTARCADQLTLIAFYADCHHEVRPVTEGHRVVLVYHLMLEGGPVAWPMADDDSRLAALADSVTAHFATPVPTSPYSERVGEPPDKLVYLLDHEYTRSSLGWQHLKGEDGMRAGALRKVAERLDCEIFLALADVHETWQYEDDGYDDWGHRGYRRYHGDEPGDDDVDPADIELTELIDSDLQLRHWIDAAGRSIRAIATHVGAREVCHTRASSELEPFRSEHEGFMGNWGNTAERWYHRAAVVMWPRGKSFVIRARLSPAWALGQVSRALRGRSPERARGLVRSVVPFWSDRAAQEAGKPFFAKTLRVASGLEDRELAASLLAPFRLRLLGTQALPQVVALAERYGLAWCRDRYLEWERGGNRHADDGPCDGEWLELMPAFCRMLSEGGSQPARELASWIVSRQWSVLERRARRDLEDSAHPYALERLTEAARWMVRVLESAAAVGEREVHAAIAEFLTSDKVGYPVGCVLTALRDVRARHAPRDLRALGLACAWSSCLERLRSILATPPRSAGDWSIRSPLRCQCDLCRTLGQFLAHRDQSRLEWPLAQARRAHVHQQLDGYRLPVSHVTRRTGRPYTLVLVKTKALFEREAELRKSLQRDLTWLARQRRAFT